MLALGLPTNATAAIMLAALQGWGLEPGPLLMEKQPVLVWTLVASLFIGNTMLLLLNLPLAPAWAKLLQIPRPYLYAGILFFASMGAYAVNAQPFDLFLLLGLGLVGFVLRRFGLPVLPLIIGVILGPLAELQGRRSLQLSGGELGGLVGGPVAWCCYAVILVVLLWPLGRLAPRAWSERPGGTGGSGGSSGGGSGDDGTNGGSAGTLSPTTTEVKA
jgi:putative tricarboxylic transport membrane protein